MVEKKKNFEKQVLDSLAKISSKLIDHDDEFVELKVELKDFMLTHFDKIYGRFEKLEHELISLSSAVKRLEDKVEKLERVSREEIDIVKKQVLNLLNRIEKLEAKVGV